MTKQKKTALDLVCEKYVKEIDFDCDKCVLQCKDMTDCDVALKQYFQEQADIPDGWDVIKQKIKKLKERKVPYSFADALVLEDICKEYGVEVENE